MSPANVRLVSLRIIFHDRSGFLDSIHKMKMSGGQKQKAAEKVSRILGNASLGEVELGKLTKYGENRIKNCQK